VVGCLKSTIFVAILVIGVTRQDSRDVEYYRCLFVGEGVLGGGLVGEGVEPGEFG
jgi:hypothetical protein